MKYIKRGGKSILGRENRPMQRLCGESEKSKKEKLEKANEGGQSERQQGGDKAAEAGGG